MPMVRCLTCGKEFHGEMPHLVASRVDGHYKRGCRAKGGAPRDGTEADEAAAGRPVDFRVARYLLPR